MAILKSVTVMRGPGSTPNAPYPASGIQTLAGNTIVYRAITGDIPGVNSVVIVRGNNSRTLRTSFQYYVNETVAQLDTKIIGG